MTENSENDKRAVGYVRVSEGGDAVDLSVAAQKQAIEQFAAEAGYQVVEWYVDEAHSGLDMERQAFQELLEAARCRKFPAVVVSNWSQLVRDTASLLEMSSRLREAGVRVFSVSEGECIGPDTLVAKMFASVRECYSRATKRGIAASRRRKKSS